MSSNLMEINDIQSVGTLNVKSSVPTPSGPHVPGVVLATLEGPFGSFIEATRNNRLYIRKLWEMILSSPEVKEMFDTKTFFGESDHPLAYQDRLETHMPNVSHCVTKLELLDDGTLWGELDILDTPHGRLVKTFIDYGSKLGISSRGAGEVITDQDGNPIVNPDTYTFITFDLVVMPGAKCARLDTKGQLNESRSMRSVKDEFSSQLNEAITNNDIDSLRTMNILLESVNDPEFDTLKKQVTNLLEEDDDTITPKATEELLDAYDKISEMEDEIRDVTHNYEVARNISVNLQTELDELKNTLFSMHDKVSEYELTISKLKSELQKVKNESSTTISDLEIRLSDAVEEADQYKDKYVSAQAKVSDLTRVIAEDQRKSESKITQLTEKLRTSESNYQLKYKELDDYKKSSDSRLSLVESRHKDLLNEYVSSRCDSLGLVKDKVLNEMYITQDTTIEYINEFLRKSMRTSLNEAIHRSNVTISSNESVNKVTYPSKIDDQSEDKAYLRGISDIVSMVRGQ